jgi:hypothetical protein
MLSRLEATLVDTEGFDLGIAATAAGEASPPIPPPTPTPESLGKVEDEAPAELDGSAGADESWRAGDRTRTGDVQLGKLAFYH